MQHLYRARGLALATVGLALVVWGRPAHASCQSFDCHFQGRLSAINNAHTTLQETEGVTTSKARAARYRALRLLATADPTVLIVERDLRWEDSTGFEIPQADDGARYMAEADTLLAQWRAETPDDPAAWLVSIPSGTHARLRYLEVVHTQFPDHFDVVRLLADALRTADRGNESWALVATYVNAHPDEPAAYVLVSDTWHRDETVPSRALLARWLERFPNDLKALRAAIQEFSSAPQFLPVVEAIPTQLARIDVPLAEKAQLCNELLWLDEARHLGLECHIVLAGEEAVVAPETGEANGDDSERRWFDTFFDTALELDRWDAAETLLATLPPRLRESALFEAVENLDDHDGHCDRALTLLDRIDLAMPRADHDAWSLVRVLTRCGASTVETPATYAASRRMAEVAFAGLNDRQLTAAGVWHHHDLLAAEIERRLVVDATNVDLHADLDHLIARRLKNEHQCPEGRISTLTDWAAAVPDDAEPWRRMGEAYRASHRPARATRALVEAWTRAPTDQAVMRDLVEAAMASNELDVAQTVAEGIRDQAETPREVALAHRALFHIAVARDDVHAAIAHGRQYFPLAARYVRLAKNADTPFLTVLRDAGRYEEIEGYVRSKARTQDPQNTASPLYRRDAVWRAPWPVLDDAPHSAEHRLGETWRTLGRPHRALPHYRAALAGPEPHGATAVGLAHAYVALGEQLAAQDAWQQAVALDPARILDHARFLLDQNLIPALEALEATLTTDDQVVVDRLSVLVARGLVRDHRMDEAEARLAALVARNTKAFGAHFMLGQIFHVTGRFAEARTQYRAYAGTGLGHRSNWPEKARFDRLRCLVFRRIKQLSTVLDEPVPADPS